MKIEIVKRLLLLLLLVGATQLFACEGGAGSGVPASDPELSGQPGTGDDEPQKPAEAVTYYVSTTGSDAAAGTIDAPLRTIGSALRRVKPGDTVEVRGGDYCERIAPSVSGKRDKPITLKSYEGEIARIVGTGLAFAGWNAALVRVDVDYMTFENLHVCHAVATEANSDAKGFYITGAPCGVTLRGCSIYEIKSTVTRRAQEEGSDWRSAHAILAIGTDDTRPIRDLVIEDCEIYEIHTGTSETMSIVGNIEGFAVRRNYLHDVENIGIIVAGGDNLNPGGDARVNFARNGLLSENRIERCTHTKSPEYWGESAYGAIGLYVCGGASTVIERNTVTGCDRGIGLVSESDLMATTGCIVRNNFVYGNYRTGIYMGDYLNYYGAGTRDCHILNNTLWGNNRVGGALESDRDTSEGEIRLTENCRNNVVKNNIIYACSDRDIFIRKYTASGSDNVIDYNHYYCADVPARWMWNGVLYTDFAAWQRACRGDEHSVYGVDPCFRASGPEAPDLHLQAASPARLTGEALPAYFTGECDIDGDPRRTNGAINKGADQ